MPDVYANQETPYPEPEVNSPDQGKDRQTQGQQPQQKTRSSRSLLSGVAANKGRAGIIVVIVAIVIVVVFILLSASPKKRPVARLPAQQQQQQGPQNQLPNGPASGPQVGLNASDQDVTADAIQKTAQNAPKQENGASGQQPEGTAPKGQAGSGFQQNNGNLGQVQPFQPPPVPGSGNGQWVPQPYNGYSAGPPSASSATAQQVSNSRRQALTKASMTYVTQQSSGEQIAGNPAPGSEKAAISNDKRNFGYRPGYHLSTHLETVASTAVAAPVIAVVDYDYQRNGITIVPAGSRIIGTMGGSSETGIVNLRFSEVRLPNGNTVEISAVGLNHQLMPIKGYVTGRHQIQQFLLAALAGMGSTSAVFAGNNVNGQLTEADLMRMQAANAADNSISNYASDLQQRVSQSLVVTVPAGIQVEVMFTNEDKQATSKVPSSSTDK